MKIINRTKTLLARPFGHFLQARMARKPFKKKDIMARAA
jgi:hypothetical protein